MNINLIGVPIFLGCDIEGVDIAPNKLREKKIVDIITNNNHKVFDLGNIYVKDVNKTDKFSSHKKMKYIDTIIEVNTNLAHQVYNSVRLGDFPFIVGGDHSVGLGSIAGSSKHFDNLGVIWIDAHGDINTHETSPSGNVHGMPLAASMGIGHSELTNIYYSGIKVKKENVFIIGARDLDLGELNLIKDNNLNVWTMDYIKEHGIEQVIKELLNNLAEKNIKNVHLSFDIDCLDKSLVPGTGTPVENGFNIEITKYLLKNVLQTGFIKSMDFVELNALLDKDEKTASIAVDLIDYTFKYLK
jgi:arginase